MIRGEAEAVRTITEAVQQRRILVRALDAVRAAGAQSFVVGGSVRDALLGHSPKDLDIECHGIDNDELARALREVTTVLDVGQSFGVLKVPVRTGETVDFSTPRREQKLGAGHRGFSVSLEPSIGYREAARRRDFTINAMGVDLDHQRLHDPYGGIADLRDGILRHVSDAFAEDPLRVLRGARFAARFGFVMHPDTVALSASIASTFNELARERVWGEFDLIFRTTAQPSRAFDVLVQTTWIQHFPDLVAIIGVPQDARWHPEGAVDIHSGLAADAAVRVAERHHLIDTDRQFVVCAALLHDLGKATHTQHQPDGRITAHGHAEAGVEPARRVLHTIGAPHDLVAKVLPVVREHMCCVSTDSPSRAAVRRLARRLAPASINEWAWLCEADSQGRGPASGMGCAGPWLEVAAALGVEHEPTKPLLRGQHLMARGWQPGRSFGPVLAAALEAQESGEFDDEAGAEQWLTTHYPQPPDR